MSGAGVCDRKRKWRKDAGVGIRAGETGAVMGLLFCFFNSFRPQSDALPLQGGGWVRGMSACETRRLPAFTPPLPVVFPTRTISTCPSTSRPASCSVGEGAPARSAVGGGLPVVPCHQKPGAVKIPVEMPYSSDLFALQGRKRGKSVLAPCFLLLTFITLSNRIQA